jgi:hypothetical protein
LTAQAGTPPQDAHVTREPDGEGEIEVDLAHVAGRLVGVPLAGLARLRSGKPMHPRGAVFSAVLERHGSGSGDGWGVPWLDTAATQDAVVRLSRSAGLPAPLPDVLGLALRLPSDSGTPIDLLLSTTGRGAVTRLLPAPRRDTAAVYSSIMGYRSDAGTLRIAALPEDDGVPSGPVPLAETVAREEVSFTLAVARGRGPWVSFARLTLQAATEPSDPPIRFDAVLHPPPGLVPDGPMARFRVPAYAKARAAAKG